MVEFILALHAATVVRAIRLAIKGGYQMDDTKPKSNKGFASMTPERRREVASKGGKAVKPQNRSFSRDKDLAREAGKKGGKNVKPQNRTFFKNRELARSAGKSGGNPKAET